MRLWDYIKEAMLRNPGQKVFEDDAVMSYEDMVVFSELFAKKLTGEKCCAILCASEMAASMALLGCFAAGVTAVPLSVRYGETHCNKIINFISPTSIITDMDGELQIIHIEDSLYKQPRQSPALIMCTSGTTGAPKGAMLSEKNILTNVKDITAYLDIRNNDTILIARPLYHCAVLTGEFLVSLLKGANIMFFSYPFNPNRIINIIVDNQITVFCTTPTLLDVMSRFLRNKSSKLRIISISGECMSESVAKRIAKAFQNANIYHVYGLTEACPRVSYLPPEKFNEHPTSVGQALNSVTIKIVKSDGCIAKTGEEGILWVCGDNVMLGYYNNPKLTEKTLSDGWLCTGDIASIDSNGFLTIKGRSDDLIIRAGMNIYPQEIESALRCDPRVKEVMAFGIKDSKFGTQIGLKIAGDFTCVDEVKQMCIKALPSFQHPTVIELVEELPKNASGKIIRSVCRD